MTFSAHALYGRPGGLKETTARYRVELVARPDRPHLRKVADRLCSESARSRRQTNDSASGPSGGTRPSAAARVSRPRIAA